MMENNMVIALAEDLGTAFSGARWAYAGKMMLLGMVMVFAVLGLLWAVLTVFKLVMVGKTPKEAKPEEPKSVAPTVTSASVPVPKALSDEELVAILTAAVAAYRASEGMDAVDAGAFRVVSFRRAASGRAWNAR